MLDGPALTDFLLDKANIQWDSVIMESMTIDDIDPKAIDVFKQHALEKGRIPSLTESTSTERILSNLKLMNSEGELTRAAALLFGKDPREAEFTAYLKIGKFGQSSADLLIQDVIECNAFETS